MTPNRKPPQRRSIRLQNHDYRNPGAYFVTMCMHQRQCLLGEIQDTAFKPTPLGEIVANCWQGLPCHYPNVALDAFVVMPNHIHGTIVLVEHEVPKPLSEIVRGFKTFSARRINQYRNFRDTPVWQRGYFEHVIRSDAALDKIRGYIAANPANWSTDRENPDSLRAGLKPAPTADLDISSGPRDTTDG